MRLKYMQRLFQLLKNKSFYKYGIGVVLLTIPLYPKFPVFNIPGIYVAVRMEDFIIAILGVIWFVDVLSGGIKKFFEDKLNFAIVLFFTAGGLSILSALFITQSVSFHIAFLHWLRRIEYMIPFFIAVRAMREKNTEFFIKIILIAGFISFLYGFGQVHFGFPVISTQNEEYSKGIALRWLPGARLHSTFSGHYDLAAFLVMVFPILFAYIFVLKKFSAKFLWYLFLTVPLLWLFLKTESRVSFMAYLLGVSLTLWIIRKRLFIVPFFFISVLGMFVLSDLGSRYVRGINVYREKFTQYDFLNINFPPVIHASEGEVLSFQVVPNTDTTEDRSTSIRLNVEWPRAIRAFAKNPLLGTGYSSITLATDNDYLRSLGEVGLLGTLAFLLVFVRLANGFTTYMRSPILDVNKAFVGGFIGGLVGFLFNATFIDVFEASKVAIIFWTFAGIAVGIVKFHKVDTQD